VKHLSIPVALLTALLSLAACVTPTTNGTAPLTRNADNTAPANNAAKKQAAQSIVTGRIVAPANVIATGGGNLIGQAGGNVIATGGMNVIATGGGNFQTLQASQAGDTLISGAEVFLADAGGTPFPGMPPVSSGADGKYTIPNVLVDSTYMVVARFKTADGKSARLQTLVRPNELGSTADVSAATSLVTAAVVTGSRKAFGALNPATFSLAVATVEKHATKDKLPNWTDPTAVVASIQQLQNEVGELKTQLASIKRDVEMIKASLDEVDKRLDDLERSPSPSPNAGTTPSDPAPSASAQASAAPTPTPTPAPEFDLDGAFSPTDNPGGAFEYMSKIVDDYQRMKTGNNVHGRNAWVATNRDTGEKVPASYIENRIPADGTLDVKPEVNYPAAVRWTAPLDGKIKVAVTLSLFERKGNGVKLEIYSDRGAGTGLTQVRQKELLPTDKPISLTETVTVRAGDRVFVHVGAAGDGASDESNLGVHISY
jgi:hypothetical protein